MRMAESVPLGELQRQAGRRGIPVPRGSHISILSIHLCNSVTGKPSPYTRNAVVNNGVLDPGVNFIAKPFTFDQLDQKIREVLS